MPERESRQRVRHVTLTAVKGLTFLFLAFVAYTELVPSGVASGSIEHNCSHAVRLYAGAVLTYHEDKGRWPHSLEQVVPLYLPEHRPCDGTFTGSEPQTRFGLQKKVRELLCWAPPPQIPDYSLVQRPDGSHSFEILCYRAHERRHGYRGDRGDFTLSETP